MMNLQKRQRDRDDKLAKETEMMSLQKRQRDRDDKLAKQTERQR